MSRTPPDEPQGPAAPAAGAADRPQKRGPRWGWTGRLLRQGAAAQQTQSDATLPRQTGAGDEASSSRTAMSGSLPSAGAVDVLRLLGEMRKTGRLQLARGRWTAEMWLDRGRVVAATCGVERGVDALDAAVLALGGGSFTFLEMADLPSFHYDLSFNVDQVAAHAAKLPGRGLVTALLDPAAIPRLRQREGEQQGPARATWTTQGPPPPVVLEPPTLRLLLALDGKRTVAQLAERFGLTRTIKGLATLADLGLVSLPETPSPPDAGATSRDAARQPAAAPEGLPSSESRQIAGADGSVSGPSGASSAAAPNRMIDRPRRPGTEHLRPAQG